LCLEVGVGIRFTARIRSGGAVYKRSQKPGMMAPESEILLMKPDIVALPLQKKCRPYRL